MLVYTMSSDEEEPNDPETLRGIRTNAKRRHTRLANGLMALMDGEKGTEKVSVALAVLQEAYDEVVRVNARYKEVVKDKSQEADAWEEEITTRYQGCRESAESYLKRDKDSNKEHSAAKKRRLELEYEQEQAKIEEQRRLEDNHVYNQRKQQNRTLEMELQRKLEGLDEPAKKNFNPKMSSTILEPNEAITSGIPPINASWPKISITPFNGDPRTWPEFELTFTALFHNTRMPEAMKLLALRENLEPEVRRRVAHLFVSTADYKSTCEALKERYGNRQIIIPAHIQQLLALQPFKAGDLKALVNMAALVKDAATNMHLEESKLYSHVVTQLAKSLPSELYREWGRHAYSLLPGIPGLAEFDKWIEGVVGAEELMGASTSRSSPKTQTPPSTVKSAKFGPTVRATEIKASTAKDDTCTVCHANPGHPLAFCQKFIDLEPTKRAEAVAVGKLCFRCLGRRHFSADCKKSTKCTVADCEQWHHPLLHGSGRIFPRRSGK